MRFIAALAADAPQQRRYFDAVLRHRRLFRSGGERARGEPLAQFLKEAVICEDGGGYGVDRVPADAPGRAFAVDYAKTRVVKRENIAVAHDPAVQRHASGRSAACALPP